MTANSVSSAPFTNAQGAASRSVQVNGTPRKNPRNSGGSPSGVSRPAPFETMKMKNTTMCVAYERRAFARSMGRISSTDAPVVPTTLPKTAPIARNVVLTSGVPTSVPLRQMPPEIVNSAPKSAMNAA